MIKPLILPNGLARPLCLVCLALAAPALQAQERPQEPARASSGMPFRLIGDVGVGMSAPSQAGRAQADRPAAFPYANFDIGPAFARIDTFGVKLAPAGAGSVELLTRVLEDGYTPAAGHGALGRRKASLPLGVGTLQTTPVGAFMVNGYRDVGKSGGGLVDLMYAAEIEHGALALYPQLGLEYRSAAYVRYYHGVTPLEGQRAGLAAYTPGAASNLYAALFFELRLSEPYYLVGNLRRTWLASAVGNSPLVGRHTVDSGLVALAYRFK